MNNDLLIQIQIQKQYICEDWLQDHPKKPHLTPMTTPWSARANLGHRWGSGKNKVAPIAPGIDLDTQI